MTLQTPKDSAVWRKPLKALDEDCSSPYLNVRSIQSDWKNSKHSYKTSSIEITTRYCSLIWETIPHKMDLELILWGSPTHRKLKSPLSKFFLHLSWIWKEFFSPTRQWTLFLRHWKSKIFEIALRERQSETNPMVALAIKKFSGNEKSSSLSICTIEVIQT